MPSAGRAPIVGDTGCPPYPALSPPSWRGALPQNPLSCTRRVPDRECREPALSLSKGAEPLGGAGVSPVSGSITPFLARGLASKPPLCTRRVPDRECREPALSLSKGAEPLCRGHGGVPRIWLYHPLPGEEGGRGDGRNGCGAPTPQQQDRYFEAKPRGGGGCPAPTEQEIGARPARGLPAGRQRGSLAAARIGRAGAHGARPAPSGERTYG